MNAMLRIALVDDHALCRNGLTELLERRGGMQVMAATGDAEQVALGAGLAQMLLEAEEVAHLARLWQWRGQRDCG